MCEETNRQNQGSKKVFTPIESPLKFNGKHNQKRRERRTPLFLTGFTLIELIVVIAIMTVIAGISLSSSSKLAGDRITGDARKLVSDLCWIRQMAASGKRYCVNCLPLAVRQNYIVTFDTVGESYRIYQGSINPNNLIKTQNLSPGVDLASVSLGQLTFSFPQGTTQDNTITLTSSGKTRQINVIGNTGYANIQ